jgi:hypothetical protein
MNESNTVVYDKAKYHDETIQGLGLPDDHACNHTTFFMSWLVKNRLMSDDFEYVENNPVNDYRLGKIPINELYEWWDCCLISEMLSPEGNAFAQAYFDFDKGMYLNDYGKFLQKNLPTQFHVPYTADNEAIIHAVIGKRYKDWKKGKKWWQF